MKMVLFTQSPGRGVRGEVLKHRIISNCPHISPELAHTYGHNISRPSSAGCGKEPFAFICALRVIRVPLNLKTVIFPLEQLSPLFVYSPETRHKHKKPRYGHTEQTNRHHGCHFRHWAAAYALIVKVRRHQNHRGGKADAPHSHRHEYHPIQNRTI